MCTSERGREQNTGVPSHGVDASAEMREMQRAKRGEPLAKKRKFQSSLLCGDPTRGELRLASASF